MKSGNKLRVVKIEISLNGFPSDVYVSSPTGYSLETVRNDAICWYNSKYRPPLFGCTQKHELRIIEE